MAARSMAPQKPTPKKPVARKSATKKPSQPRKKTTKKRGRGKGKQQKNTWLGALAGFMAKLSLVILVVLVGYGIYLDGKIQAKFDGDKWQLPATVYGRELLLYPGLRISREELQTELALLNYRKVKTARNGGEYAASEHKLEVVRRSFEFADGREPEIPLLLTFKGQRLSTIQHRDSGEVLAQVRLDPVLLDRLNVSDKQERILVKLEDLPPLLIQSLLLTEDRDFYRHDGISPTAIIRAFMVNMRSGRTVQGGSTITQQLAKNFFLTQERSLSRKAKEAYMALLIDWRYSKDEILESYFNEVYLGQNGATSIHGIGLASYFYFGIPVSDLSEGQAAMMIALVKGPSYYDPWRNPERAKARRDLVLRLLTEAGEISADQYQESAERELGLVARGSMGYQRIPGFLSLVSRELQSNASNWRSLNGIKVYTTLDPLSQRFAQDAAVEQLNSLDSSDSLQTAIVVSERHTGAIRAMVGGKERSYQGFNRALDGHRQIGSLVKPFVYLAALENGHQLGELIADKPYTVTIGNDQEWTPNNYSKTFSGDVMLHKALANSLNVPTVRIGMEVGLASVLDVLKRAGLEQELEPFPSLLLGSFSLSPFQVAQLYQTLADDGEKRDLYAVQQVNDSRGQVLYRADDSAERQWSEMHNFQIIHAMQEATRSGTAKSLSWRIPEVDLAGKTGTTNELRDSWYVGIDNREVVTVWVGRDNNQPAGVTGSSAALPIYAAYLKKSFPQSLRPLQPDQLNWVHYAESTGKPTLASCGNSKLLPAPTSEAARVGSCLQEQVKKTGSWFINLFN